MTLRLACARSGQGNERGVDRRSLTGMHGEGGFTILEMLLSMAIMVGVTAAIFQLVDPAHGTYRTQPEVSDLQQRLRVSTSFLASDLVMAGAGAPSGGMNTGSLMNYFAPIQPFRTGVINSDVAAGVLYRDDAITIFYVPVGAPQTSLDVTMPPTSSELKITPEGTPSCAGQAKLLSCAAGFQDGMKVIVFDESGAWDDITITEVQDGSMHLQHNKSVPGNQLSKEYHPATTQIAQVAQRTYYHNAATNQLVYYDGYQREEVVVDNVVDLQFEYFGEARPPTYYLDAGNLPQTTYGPKPPIPPATNGTTWPAGENCIFSRPAGQVVSRLANLAPGSAGLVQLTQAQLTDGPWCPDGGFPTRFDADLYRVRKVGVMLRVQVASADLRGPAGALFRNGGTGMSGRSLVPDQEIRFEVTPRNINLGR